VSSTNRVDVSRLRVSPDGLVMLPEDDQRIGAARRFGAVPYASGDYVNVLADEGESGVHRAYPAGKLARLAALKRHYDPDNVFHLNQHIRPDQ
jgi:Berberine and berberine like